MLLEHYLKQLRLPTMVREYRKLGGAKSAVSAKMGECRDLFQLRNCSPAAISMGRLSCCAFAGSGANLSCGKFSRCDVSIDPNSDQADNAARQISGSVARHPPSLPILNCPFLIFSASSIPLITMSAVSKLLSPNIGRNRCLILR